MSAKFTILLTGFMALFFTGMSVQAQDASITSDQPDYKPGTTATFTGTGFSPGEQVKIKVLHAENHPLDYAGSEHEPWMVAADSSGNFQTTWKLSDSHCDKFIGYLKGNRDATRAIIPTNNGIIRLVPYRFGPAIVSVAGPDVNIRAVLP